MNIKDKYELGDSPILILLAKESGLSKEKIMSCQLTRDEWIDFINAMEKVAEFLQTKDLCEGKEKIIDEKDLRITIETDGKKKTGSILHTPTGLMVSTDHYDRFIKEHMLTVLEYKIKELKS